MGKVKTILKPPRIRRKATAWEKAYIAGLVDARAIFLLFPDRRRRGGEVFYTMLILYGPSIDVFKIVQERYGGLIKFEDRSKENAMSRYKLEINKKKDIANLITDIMQYLTAKKKQASLLLRYCQSRLEALKRVEHAFLAPITKEERKIARQLMELNQIHRESRYA